MTKQQVYCNLFTLTAKVSLLPHIHTHTHTHPHTHTPHAPAHFNETVFALNADVNKVLTSVGVVSS